MLAPPEHLYFNEAFFKSIKDLLKKEIRLNIILTLLESRKKWTDLLDFGLSLPKLQEHMAELEKDGIVKRKCDTFHLIAQKDTIYDTVNLAIKDCKNRLDFLRDFLLKL